MLHNQVDIRNWDPITLGKKGPNFSHLFFADDLTLMVRANHKSSHAIKKGPGFFCKLSGQNINTTKSKIIFSTNCPTTLTNDITNILDIKKSDSFGTYLGFPILNKHPRPKDYQFIIDKMRAKLTAWKIKFLNIAGRTTLSHSCLNSIPNHYMQFTLLPMNILKKIDKVQRDFIWGTTNEERKIHLINWLTVCQPKNMGGLGLHKAKDKNMCTLANLAWRTITNPTTPWAQLIINTYANNKNTRKNSFIWKGILKGWELCSKGINWQLHSLT